MLLGRVKKALIVYLAKECKYDMSKNFPSISILLSWVIAKCSIQIEKVWTLGEYPVYLIGSLFLRWNWDVRRRNRKLCNKGVKL